MKGEFKILNNGNVIEYNDYNDIPTNFDNLISFKPYWPEPPHTEEDHALIETYNTKLKELMEREKN